MGENLRVLGGRKVLLPSETAGGLRGLHGQLLLVEPLLVSDEDDAIGSQAGAMFDEAFGSPVPVATHLWAEIQIKLGANSGQRGLRRANQIFVTDFEVMLGLSAAGAALLHQMPPIPRQSGDVAPRGRGRRETPRLGRRG